MKRRGHSKKESQEKRKEKKRCNYIHVRRETTSQNRLQGQEYKDHRENKRLESHKENKNPFLYVTDGGQDALATLNRLSTVNSACEKEEKDAGKRRERERERETEYASG